MNIKNAADIIDQVNETVENWEYFSGQVGVSNDLSKAIKKTFVTI